MATIYVRSCKFGLLRFSGEGDNDDDRIYHIDVVYECIEEKFGSLGGWRKFHGFLN